MNTVYRTTEIRVPENVEESRKVRFQISDESKDRHGTVLNMNGWDLSNFNRNGIVGYQHDVYGGGMCNGPDPDSVIGKGRAWLEGAVLMGEVEFEPEDVNPLAEKIFRKVLHGTLKATSVGFVPIGGGRLVNDKTGEEKQLDESPWEIPKGHTYHFDGQELLEFSIVNIPSNPNALKKNLRNQTANALHFLKRELGQDVSYGEIEQMRVLDVVKMLETGEKPEKKTYTSVDGTEFDSWEDRNAHERKVLREIEKETEKSQPVASNGLRLQLRRIKNRKQANKLNEVNQ